MSPSVLTETESRRWHPATEIIVLGCALVLVFGIPSPVVPLLVLAGSTIAAVASPSVKVATWAATVAVLCVPMLIVVGLVQGLFYPGDEVRVLWRAGPVRLSIEGLAIAVQQWLRVTALVACAPSSASAAMRPGSSTVSSPCAFLPRSPTCARPRSASSPSSALGP